jgi:hypothetical protein
MGSAVGAKWIEIEGYGGAQASCKSKKEPVPRRNSASPMLADSWGGDGIPTAHTPHLTFTRCHVPKKQHLQLPEMRREQKRECAARPRYGCTLTASVLYHEVNH